MSQNIKVGIIYGSTREGRFCDTVVSWLFWWSMALRSARLTTPYEEALA